jgi:hypothetical protein
MSGEINGTKAILLLGDDGDYTTIVGQMDLTNAFTGTLIDVSTKSDNDFVVSMNNELAGNGDIITSEIIYSNNANFRTIRTRQVNHAITDFLLSFNNNNEVDLYVSGIVSGMVDTLPPGASTKSAFTINSTGAVFRAYPYKPSGSDSYQTSDSKTYQVRI